MHVLIFVTLLFHIWYLFWTLFLMIPIYICILGKQLFSLIVVTAEAQSCKHRETEGGY